jgi:hypothetical protein
MLHSYGMPFGIHINRSSMCKAFERYFFFSNFGLIFYSILNSEVL